MSTLSQKVRVALGSALDVSAVTDFATSGVWHLQAPAGSEPPLVIYNRLTTEEIYRTFGRGYASEAEIWHIKSHVDKDAVTTAGETVSEHNEKVLIACETALGNTLTLSGGSQTLNVERARDLPEVTQKFDDRDVIVASFLLRVVSTG